MASWSPPALSAMHSANTPSGRAHKLKAWTAMLKSICFDAFLSSDVFRLRVGTQLKFANGTEYEISATPPHEGHHQQDHHGMIKGITNRITMG